MFTRTQEIARECIGYNQLTSLSSAQSVPQTRPDALVHIQAEAQDLRYRADGVSPTSTVGTLIKADDTAVIYVPDPSKIRIIETTTGGIVNIHVFK